MKADNPKGFVYKQAFLPRLIFIVSLVLFVALLLQFVLPISIFGTYHGISIFFSFSVGTLIGTYIANLVIKSSKLIEEQSDNLSNIVEKGKDIIEDIANEIDQDKQSQELKDDKSNSEQEITKHNKSARERLKDKGYM